FATISSGLCFFCAMAPSSKGPKAYFTEDHFPGSRPKASKHRPEANIKANKIVRCSDIGLDELRARERLRGRIIQRFQPLMTPDESD
ncbi:hypothetical protein KHC28_00090, partial [Ancylobacter sonchi]|uniref:hypothetical protein n=1 Tax=Ancylobacter sonchi TaxID=1937790 RepID=UPI001BD2EA8C